MFYYFEKAVFLLYNIIKFETNKHIFLHSYW